MDHEFLTKRRAEILARHAVLESVPGSGWHAHDARARDELLAGHALISQRPVALQHDSDFYFLGPDVAVVQAALRAFVEQYDAARGAERVAADLARVEVPEVPPVARHAYRTAKKYADRAGSVLELPSQEFNGVLYCLNTLKILVVTAGVLA